MASDEPNPALPEESSPATLPIIPPLLPSFVPPIAPIPPLPLRPPPPNNVEAKSDSDSDKDDPGYLISDESRADRERQQKAVQDLLMKRRAAALAVPTNDMSVRTRLRRLGEPITLFGEREMERRDRLRTIMVKLDAEGQLEKLMKAHEEEEAVVQDGEEEIQYPFYTEGSKQLLDARIDIGKYSVLKVAMRIQRARRKRDDPDEDMDAEIDWVLKQAGSLVLDCSEIGDDRPLSGCSFSNDGKLLATW